MASFRAWIVVLAASGAFACAAERQLATQTIQNPELQSFVAYADRDWPANSEQYGMTLEALERLYAALESLAEQKDLSPEIVRQRVVELRIATSTYEAGRQGAAAQAQRLRQIFISSANLVDDLVRRAALDRAGIDPRLSAVRRAADSLDPDTTLLRQGDTIERFFRHAAHALTRIDRGAVRATGSGTI